MTLQIIGIILGGVNLGAVLKLVFIAGRVVARLEVVEKEVARLREREDGEDMRARIRIAEGGV